MDKPTTYVFTKPALLLFYGGRWDGMEIESLKAPELLFIGPDGQGITPTDDYAPCPPGWTPYLRMAGMVPPIRYGEAEAA